MRLPGYRTILAAAPAAAAFALYLRTMARHGDFGNGPMLAVAADELGVPGRAGYPLYMLLAHAILRWMPAGEPIFRTTVLSALCAALAVAVVGVAAYRLTKRWWAGAFAGLLLGVSDALWSQAVVTDIYGLHALLSACVLAGMLAWLRTGRPTGLYAGMACFGLAMANAPIALTWAPMVLAALAVGVRQHRPAPGQRALATALSAVAVGLLPLALYALVPAFGARDPMISFANAGASWLDPPAVTWHTRWRAAVDYFGIPREHVREGYLLWQYGFPVIWLAPLGIWALARKRRDALAVTALAYLGPVTWVIGSGTPEAGPLYLASHMAVALWIGMGARVALFAISRGLRRALRERAGRKRVRALLVLGLLVLPVFVMAGNYRAIDRSGTDVMRSLGRALLDRADRNSIIIVSGQDWTYSALYVQRLERKRPDVVLLLDTYFRWPNMPLIERERRRGLVVRKPQCAHAGDELHGAAHAWCCMHQVIWDNYAGRTVYIAGPLAGLVMAGDAVRERLPACRRVGARAAMIEFAKPQPGSHIPEVPEPPALEIVPGERSAEPHDHPHSDHDHEH